MPDDTSNGPSDRFQFPPIEHAIWEEIANLLPESHLKTYWKGLALIQEIPAHDPMIVAILAMGIVTISARQVPAEIAVVVETIKVLVGENFRQNLATNEETRRIVQVRLDNIRTEFRDIFMDLKNLREDVRWAQGDMVKFRSTLGGAVESEVEKVIAVKSYFDRRPLAIGYLASGALAIGVVLGFVLRGIVS